MKGGINMAEFCLECYNKINNTDYKKKDVVVSSFPELCEGCGECKKIVISESNRGRTGCLIYLSILVIFIIGYTVKSIFF